MTVWDQEGPRVAKSAPGDSLTMFQWIQKEHLQEPMITHVFYHQISRFPADFPSNQFLGMLKFPHHFNRLNLFPGLAKTRPRVKKNMKL